MRYAATWRTVCRYEREHVNPVTKRRGRWRVVSSTWGGIATPTAQVTTQGLLEITTAKHYPKGSYIVPHRALNRILQVMALLRELHTTVLC